MNKQSSRGPHRRRSRTPFIALLATLAFAAGGQALAPAPAAALRTEVCTDMGIFGNVCTYVEDGQGEGGGGVAGAPGDPGPGWNDTRTQAEKDLDALDADIARDGAKDDAKTRAAETKDAEDELRHFDKYNCKRGFVCGVDEWTVNCPTRHYFVDGKCTHIKDIPLWYPPSLAPGKYTTLKSFVYGYNKCEKANRTLNELWSHWNALNNYPNAKKKYESLGYAEREKNAQFDWKYFKCDLIFNDEMT